MFGWGHTPVFATGETVNWSIGDLDKILGKLFQGWG